jgi:ABC-type cobalamin/Fe3+-siderophores transport system ATPase subunit
MPTDRNRRMIELVRVGRNYTRADGQRVNAVDDVSLIVPEGEFVCLIGPSGYGKSTLLQMVAGLDAPSSGAIVVDGKEIEGPGRERAGWSFSATVYFRGCAWSTMLNTGSSVVASRPARAGRSRVTICAGSAFRMSSRPGRANCPARC